MGPVEHLEHLRLDGAALAAAARRAPVVRVPSCPDWDTTALVGHVGVVHRWVDEIVRTAAAESLSRDAMAAEAPTDPTAALAWYEDGLSALTATLAGTDPGTPVWNWYDRRPAPSRFWFRRMALETAVHRWDAQAVSGAGQPVSTDLAVDGVDEFLTFAARWLTVRPVPALHGSLHLHATDTSGEWFVTLEADHLEQRHEHAKADAAVRGTASDLLLWLVNRKRVGEDAGLEVFGDRAIVDAWRNVTF